MNKRVWRGAALVAATYVYFLLFAEFAFIELVRPVTGDGEGLRWVMGALGAGGVTGSVLGATWYDRERWGRRLAGWFAACVAAAGLALCAPLAGAAGLVVAAAAIGVALGGATVALVAGLRAVAGAGRLGWVAGLGTGAAYALCNVPWVFEASASGQTALAALAAAGGAALAWTTSPEAPETRRTADRNNIWPWVGVFLALVWMDSAAFYIIQHTEALKDATWHGPWTLGGNAVMHFAAALLAGQALDRGLAGWVTAGAGVLLATACRNLGWAGAEVFYVAGVSLYSVALVHVPARSENPRAAAWLFAVAGWGGSALGIGMAQDLHGVPAWFGGAALALVAAGLGARRRWASSALLLGLGLVCGGDDARAETGEDAAIARGREVYIAEGCIHCHSQYVRPGTDDVVRWGPARPLGDMLKDTPPLPGNRRQGPDLLNVGNRRTPEWNRLHLVAPRAVSPGSRMPSYARLFDEAGGGRGQDLVAYLASLGAGTEEARAELVARWRPAPDAKRAVDTEAGAGWFARLCVQCHGVSGQGTGPLAARLGAGAPDLTRPGLDRDEERLARLIKFGRTGTAMAGHEALTDEAVVSLARFVAGMQAGVAK